MEVLLNILALLIHDDSTILYKTKSLDGIKPNANPKTNANTNTNLKLIQILTLFSSLGALLLSECQKISNESGFTVVT